MQFTLAIFFHLFFPSFGPHNIVANRYNPPLSDTTRKNNVIVVSIDAKSKLLIGTHPVSFSALDSILSNKVDSIRMYSPEVTVVINADTATHYGDVYRIMQSAKRKGAKVLANVK